MRNHNRAAEGAAEIVLPARSTRSRVRLVGVQGLVGKTIEKATVISIGPGLGREVINTSLSLSEFGGVIPSLKADFFQRFDRRLLVKEERRCVQIRAVLTIHQGLEG